MTDFVRDSFGEVVTSRVPNPKYDINKILPSNGEIKFYEVDSDINPVRELTDKKELQAIVKSFNGD